jgi:hypothetical protein
VEQGGEQIKREGEEIREIDNPRDYVNRTLKGRKHEAR